MENKISEKADLLDIKLKDGLSNICLRFTDELEAITKSIPIGCCYLFGYCLAKGLERAGLKTNEKTGHLIVKDKHDKYLVYGTNKYNGKLVGFYHTWCEVEYGNQKIIIDPSYKFNKIGLKKYFNKKLNKNIPDCLVTCENKTWLYSYIEDERLNPKSTLCLNLVEQNLIEYFINLIKIEALEMLKHLENNNPE